ncbi:MAG: hypothetical protein Q4C56_00650 [Peptococcaceae bacterium]|nr:hypothetical protein [Peptococcaceae bacterium]
MKCPFCNAENQQGEFCEKCGKPLPNDSADLTRLMPPLDNAAHADDDDDLSDIPEKDRPLFYSIGEKFDKDARLSYQKPAAKSAEASAEDADATESADADASAGAAELLGAGSDAPLDNDWSPEDDDFASLEDGDEDAPLSKKAKRKKILTAVALVIGVILAALALVYLFLNYLGVNEPEDPTEQVKNASTIAPDTTLPEDTIVGHWRHYNTGSVIEKIGDKEYRWTIGKKVYPLKFQDNKYTFTDETTGDSYVFVLTNSNRLQLSSAKDTDGGLVNNPIFESGYTAGRVGQDGSMTENVVVNPDAFNIIGKTYAELAGVYGPGALSVVGDDQYIVFRAKGGNFAVQFTGDTVPLSADVSQEEDGYKLVKLTNTTPVTGTTTTDDNTTSSDNSTTAGDNNSSSSSSESDNDTTEEKKYTVEIPDMPTFPSNTAVATGVVWADLGFVIQNAPSSMTVEDLSAILGISLEIGDAPANESGYSFYGMDEGYFAGTYAANDHSYYISGYGKSALMPDKTTLFIQQIS